MKIHEKVVCWWEVTLKMPGEMVLGRNWKFRFWLGRTDPGWHYVRIYYALNYNYHIRFSIAITQFPSRSSFAVFAEFFFLTAAINLTTQDTLYTFLVLIEAVNLTTRVPWYTWLVWIWKFFGVPKGLFMTFTRLCPLKFTFFEKEGPPLQYFYSADLSWYLPRLCCQSLLT